VAAYYTGNTYLTTKSQLQEHQPATITPSSIATSENTPTMHYSTTDYMLKLIPQGLYF
jgi:hypothetical protein